MDNSDKSAIKGLWFKNCQKFKGHRFIKEAQKYWFLGVCLRTLLPHPLLSGPLLIYIWYTLKDLAQMEIDFINHRLLHPNTKIEHKQSTFPLILFVVWIVRYGYLHPGNRFWSESEAFRILDSSSRLFFADKCTSNQYWSPYLCSGVAFQLLIFWTWLVVDSCDYYLCVYADCYW